MANDPYSDLRAYLDRVFPGSRIDDGYSFVFFKAPSSRRVTGASLQAVIDRLCIGDSWVVAVNVDWQLLRHPTSDEKYTALYTPDWNVEERYEAHVAVVAGTFEVTPLLRSIKTPGALGVVNPQQNVAFDVSLGRIYGRTREELDAFCSQLPDAFHARDAAYGE